MAYFGTWKRTYFSNLYVRWMRDYVLSNHYNLLFESFSRLSKSLIRANFKNLLLALFSPDFHDGVNYLLFLVLSLGTFLHFTEFGDYKTLVCM